MLSDKLSRARELRRREGTRRLIYHGLRSVLPRLIGERRAYSVLRNRYYHNEAEFWREKGKYWIEDQNGGQIELFNEQVHYLDDIFDSLDVGRSDRVLDAGCGYGKFTSGLRRAGYAAVYGLDLSPTQLQNAHDFDPTIGDYLVNGSLTDMPFTDGSFEVLFSWGVMTHIPDENIEDACSEAARVYRDLVVHVDDMNVDLFIKYGHDLKEVYEGLGYEVVMVDFDAPQPETADLKLVAVQV